MTGWRRFERDRDGVVEFHHLRVEGIRCFISWGRVDTGRGRATTSVLLDADEARRHAEKKVRELLRKGYVEVAAPQIPAGDPDALVVETIADAGTKPEHGLPRPEYRPVDGFTDVVCHARLFAKSPGVGFYHYLVLRDSGRSALAFNVRETSHDPEAVRAFLELVVTVRDLPFDGRSHHKLALPRPAGAFSHALLCSPALGQAAAAHRAIADRVASAFPIYDCEIGDADPEVLVDARISGRGALNYADWARAPQPVVDLRFDVRARRRDRDLAFKVYQRTHLDGLLRSLVDADADSWLEIRSFRGDVRRLTPGELTATTGEDVGRFLLGAPSNSGHVHLAGPAGIAGG